MKKMTLGKWKHFIFGIAIGIFMQGMIVSLLPVQLKLVTVISLTLVMVMNYCFELFSKLKGKGVYDVLDAAAGTIGGAMGMAVVVIIQFS